MPAGPTDPGAPVPAPRAPHPLLVAAAALVFVDDPLAPVVGDADLRHLLDVLRLHPGEAVVAADGAGRWVPCRVAPSSTGRGSRGADPTGLLVVDGPAVVEEPADPPVTVAFAPTKGDRPEWVAQKLCELGVDRIVPLCTARSVVRWDGERAAKSVERLRRVVREASSQCRRARLPEVADVCTLADLAATVGAAPALCDPGGGPPSLARPVLAVGPEGGWDPAERDACGPTVGLGATVLRAETAAVTAGALLCALRSSVVLPLA